jgi:hypothetical protein
MASPLSPSTKECVCLLPNKLRHIHMQFETSAHKISSLYMIPSGQPSKNWDLYKSISMPYSQPHWLPPRKLLESWDFQLSNDRGLGVADRVFLTKTLAARGLEELRVNLLLKENSYVSYIILHQSLILELKFYKLYMFWYELCLVALLKGRYYTKYFTN